LTDKLAAHQDMNIETSCVNVTTKNHRK